MSGETDVQAWQTLEATSDAQALFLLIDTLAEHDLPDDYEVKVTAGFMRGLASLVVVVEELHDERLTLRRLLAQSDRETEAAESSVAAQRDALEEIVFRLTAADGENVAQGTAAALTARELARAALAANGDATEGKT